MGNTGATRVAKAPKPMNVMVMRIVTRFTTADEFVSAFRKFCTKGTCFIPSVQATRIGVETGFSIRLADGTPMLRGLCVVRDSWATAENPFERPGVRIGLRSLTAESKPVFRRLLLAGGKAELDERPTVKVDLMFAQEERAPDADVILPANPLMEMSDESISTFVDCMLFEDAIPDLIDSGDSINDATGRIADDRNDQATRRIEITQRIETEAAPKGTPLERALAASSVRLQGGTSRIKRLDAPLARAHALAEEHADSAFGPMLAKAVDRIKPVADHTVPTRMPSERKTMVGIPPVPPPVPRRRIAARASTAPFAPSAPATPVPAAPDEPTAASGAQGWYRKLVGPRRTRG